MHHFLTGWQKVTIPWHCFHQTCATVLTMTLLLLLSPMGDCCIQNLKSSCQTATAVGTMVLLPSAVNHCAHDRTAVAACYCPWCCLIVSFHLTFLLTAVDSCCQCHCPVTQRHFHHLSLCTVVMHCQHACCHTSLLCWGCHQEIVACCLSFVLCHCSFVITDGVSIGVWCYHHCHCCFE